MNKFPPRSGLWVACTVQVLLGHVRGQLSLCWQELGQLAGIQMQKGAWQTSSAGAVSRNHPGARQPHLPHLAGSGIFWKHPLGDVRSPGWPSAVMPCSSSRPALSAKCTLPSPLSNKPAIFGVFFLFPFIPCSVPKGPSDS